MRTLYPAHSEMKGRVGVVIPTWYPADTSAEDAESFLWTTLVDSPICLEPRDIVVVVDGSETARAAAYALERRAHAHWGAAFQIIDFPENRGKGAAIVAGLDRLLDEGPRLRWIGVRDADGDHLIDDLPHMVRGGEQVWEENPERSICVIGRRAGVHAPLGWVRGEYELLLNEVVVEAIAFHRARMSQEVWDTRYLVSRVPDLQSGYKLYNSTAAVIAAASLRAAEDAHPDLRLLRTGMEIVPFVSIAEVGGIFAEVERKAFFDQPVTAYGRTDRTQFYGPKLSWVLLSTCLTPQQAAMILDPAIARRPMFTDPEGRAELLRFRRFVLKWLNDGEWPEGVSEEIRWRKLL